MGYRIFFIEHHSTPCLPEWMQEASLCEVSIGSRSKWQDVEPRQLCPCQEQIVVASAIPQTDEVWKMFQWLREHPISVPTLALLPAGDPELVRAAATSVDDFLIWPIHAEEFRQRIIRLLGPLSQALEDVQDHLLGELGMCQALGRSPRFLEALKRLALFGPSIAPVLLTGETGPGSVYRRPLGTERMRGTGARRNAVSG
jgi:hypothetical protein